MKIVAVGDTHGRLKWKEIVIKEADADKFIFIGDYFDTRDGGYSGNKQIENFKDILTFKEAKPDKVILLTGNHDFHYIKRMYEQYSGYQKKYVDDISLLVESAIESRQMQMCYQHDNFLFSHAGLTKTWCGLTMGIYNININDVVIKTINDYLVYQPEVFKFSAGENIDMSGDDVTQGPIWVRPISLMKDMVDGVTCVVGHTPVKRVAINPNLILIDCLGTSDDYLIIEDGKARAAI